MNAMRPFRLFAPLALAAALAGPALAQTSLTIYQDGRVLNRRVFPVRVPAGTSVHDLLLGAIDPASVFALDGEVGITGVRYDPAVSAEDALRRLVGHRLTFVTNALGAAVRDTVTATVLGVDPPRFLLADGRVTFQMPGLPLFPAATVPAEARMSVGVRSDRARTGLGLGYFSSGASWAANYSIVIGGATARVSGHAALTAGTLRADSVEIQLLAGNVGRAVSAVAFSDQMVRRTAMAMESAKEESVGEAHLYTLAGRHSFEPGLVTVTNLFDPVTAPVERSYTMYGQVPYYGGLPQMGDEENVPVSVSYVVARRARTAFGDLPVPAGVARVYERDGAGRPQLVGEASLDHTAAGQDLRLDAGVAFDLTATRRQMTYETTRAANRTIAVADYRVVIANARDSAATVDVLERRGGEWSVVSSSLPAEKLSSTTTRFRVRVPARGEATLTYRVRLVW